MKLTTRLKRIKRRLRPWAIKKWLLEDRYYEGLGGPPNNMRMSRNIHPGQVSTDFEYSIKFGNDASEIWIWCEWPGEPGRWEFYCSAEAFRKMALWYLWRWAWGEWFGLRRKLFYRDLRATSKRDWSIRDIKDGE